MNKNNLYIEKEKTADKTSTEDNDIISAWYNAVRYKAFDGKEFITIEDAISYNRTCKPTEKKITKHR